MKLTHVTPFTELPPIVLFVGEDVHDLPMYSAHLEQAGMWVSSSTRPVEALSAVDELRPDVIVADVDFAEGSDGLSFIDGLAISDALLAIPLIALMTDVSISIPPSAKARTTLYVPKPVVPDALVATIQQLLVESYAVRIRADRDNARLRALAERSRGLLPTRSAEADRLSGSTRTCPSCAQPLEWIENGRIGTVQYDYYQWCVSGCGLYCYDLEVQTWVKLAPSDDGPVMQEQRLQTPPLPETAVAIVTDRAGHITSIDGAGAKLINYSTRHAIGASLLLFVHQGRQELTEALRRVNDREMPARSVILWPRDRKPRAALISLRAVDGGVQWTIDAEPVPAIAPRRGRARPR